MRKYLLHILIISFVFLLTPTVPVASYAGEPVLLEHYRQAVRKNPDDARAYFDLGNVYGRSGKWEEAREAWQQAIRIDPDFVEAHSNLGLAYYLLGNYKKAIKSYKQAIRINPDYAEAHVNLGVA
jgi:tetratricopeptide (TPR) repeat protein